MEFIAKKLAEVQAFCNLSVTILERADDSFGRQAETVAASLKQVGELTVSRFVDANEQEIFQAKLAKTTTKLQNMMELYVGDEWDNPVEVLEWLSFFSGAAAAHAALVQRALTEVDADGAGDLQQIVDQFRALLDQVIEALQNVGAKRVTQSS